MTATATQTIACKSGNIFSACIEEESNSLDWLVQVGYYAQQGCVIEKKEDGTWKFSPCDCEHCKTLKHDHPTLDEEE